MAAVDIDLTAEARVVTVAGRDAQLFVYGGSLPGPLLTVREGDRVRIRFENRLPEPTNLHLHGMHIPPEVDDPHRVVAPGGSAVYEFDVPLGSAGTYWYHPHVHGEVAWQLGAGLAGAMIVRGPDDDSPALAGAAERVLVLQDLSLDGDRPRARSPMEMHDGREGELVLVNGEVTPELEAPAGLVRLRIVNASGARFYDLAVEGGETFLIGLDASMLEAPVPLGERLLLPPGQRADLLIRAAEAGAITLRHHPYRRGARRRRLPNGGRLATIAVRGEAGPVALPALSRRVERLDPQRAVTTRVFEYGGEGNMLRFVLELVRGKKYGPGEGARGPVRFWLNGREFEPGRVDVEAALGTMEIWELRNPTPLDHPFHIHIHPFQVLDVDGATPAFPAWRDVVNVPAGKTVRILVPFRDFPGTTMYHCHILEHEDNGMMGHVRVVDPGRPGGGAHACGDQVEEAVNA